MGPSISDHDFFQFSTASRTVLNCNGRLRRLVRSASRLASRAMDCFMPELRPPCPEIPCLCDPMPPRPCCMSRLKAQRPPDHLTRSINHRNLPVMLPISPLGADRV